jgi:hypothetical protein
VSGGSRIERSKDGKLRATVGTLNRAATKGGSPLELVYGFLLGVAGALSAVESSTLGAEIFCLSSMAKSM